MAIFESEFAALCGAQLAAQLAEQATSPAPVWLWSADGSHLLWANAAGAAVFGSRHAGVPGIHQFSPANATVAAIARLAATLPDSGRARLERLRGFGAGLRGALTCACVRVALVDGRPAVLVGATEPAGPMLSLQERVRRLIADDEQALAAFTADGALLYAAPAALPRLAGATTLAALGVESLAAVALAARTATGTTRLGAVAVERLGTGASTVLVLAFGPQPIEAAVAADPPVSAATGSAATLQPPAAPFPIAGGGAEPAPVSTNAPAPRRHPLRFVWQMDADGSFTSASDEFIELVGPRTVAAFGRPWSEIAAELKLDSDGQIARAVAARETFSGIVSSWPLDESSERLPVELSGLPVFDRDRIFRGYRGFGVCRDIARIDSLMQARRTSPPGFIPLARDRPVPEQSPPSPPQTPPVADAEVLPSFAPAALADIASRLATAAIEAAPPVESPKPEIAAPAPNVVPFRTHAAGDGRIPSLSPVERKAFRDLAQELTARLRVGREASAGESAQAEGPAANEVAPAPFAPPSEARTPLPDGDADVHGAPPDVFTAVANADPIHADVISADPPIEGAALADVTLADATLADARAAEATLAGDDGATYLQLQAAEPLVLDRLPISVLFYQHNALFYANRHFLEWTGYENLEALAQAGGLAAVLDESGAGALVENGGGQKLMIRSRGGERLPADGRVLTVPWGETSAHALVLTNGEAEERRRASVLALGAAENEIRDLRVMLDAAVAGALVLDREGRVVAATPGGEAMFGRPAGELAGRPLGEFFAPESERAVHDYFERCGEGAQGARDGQGVGIIQNAGPDNGIEVMARLCGGERMPLALRLTRLGADRFCAVLHGVSPTQKIQEELRSARREAQRAAAAKADFLAKVSHEIRTPLNAIVGFAEVIIAERFGPIGNERYREYLKDIHTAGANLVALLGDRLDLSKAETGELDLAFADLSLNELTQQCVGIMQPQASRARIIIRTSLAPGLPRVIADERSLRQIVLNLLSNSIRFTGPGGQVIVSTAFADSGEAVLRVRDTGAGLTAQDVAGALEPSSPQPAEASGGPGGPGLRLPLTRALAEANRAHFSIKSGPDAGTLIEIAFPPARVAQQFQ